MLRFKTSTITSIRRNCTRLRTDPKAIHILDKEKRSRYRQHLETGYLEIYSSDEDAAKFLPARSWNQYHREYCLMVQANLTVYLETTATESEIIAKDALSEIAAFLDVIPLFETLHEAFGLSEVTTSRKRKCEEVMEGNPAVAKRRLELVEEKEAWGRLR